MINLAAPTLPIPGGALADLLPGGGTVSAQNGGFADLLALQAGQSEAPVAPPALQLSTTLTVQPASEPATALPVSGKILPVGLAALPPVVQPPVVQPSVVQPSAAQPEVTAAALVTAPIMIEAIRAVAVPAAKVATEAADPAPETAPTAAVVLTMPALRPQLARPAGKAALREEPQTAAQSTPEEAETEVPVADQPGTVNASARVLTFELAQVAMPILAAPVAERAAAQQDASQPEAAPMPARTLPVQTAQAAVPQELDIKADVQVQTASTGPQVPAPVSQDRLVAASAAAPLLVTLEQSTNQTVVQPARAVRIAAQPVVAPLALMVEEAPAPVVPTAQLLRAEPQRPEPQRAEPAIAVATAAEDRPATAAPRQRAVATVLPADTTAAPLAAPQLASQPDLQPLTVTTPPRAERPVDFAELVDRLATARETAMPDRMQVAVNHAEFGKVSLRFEADGSGLNVAMSSADPDFARAVAAAAPAAAQQFASNGDALPQRSASEQSSAAGQAPSQQQNSPQQSRAETRSAERVLTRNPSPDDGDEQAPARRGLFA